MEQDYSDLIIGHIQGRLDEKKTDRFYRWVNKNSSNRKLYFETKAIYESYIPVLTADQTEKSWERLLHKREKAIPRKSLFWKKALSYAAVALIAMMVSTVSLLFLKEETEPNTACYVGGDGLIADMVILPDGTHVSLGSKSTFTYDTDYGKEKRVVYLEGEAFFDVAKQKDKPFIVKVKGQDIEALGTKFNVTGYPADSLLTTTLLEGSVRLTTDLLHEAVVLKPDQQLVYNRNKNNLVVNDVDASRVMSWTTGYYYFQEQMLKAILSRMSNIYGVQFFVKSERLNNKVFTGTFYRGQSIRDILEIIKLSIPIKYKIEDSKITVAEN